MLNENFIYKKTNYDHMTPQFSPLCNAPFPLGWYGRKKFGHLKTKKRFIE